MQAEQEKLQTCAGVKAEAVHLAEVAAAIVVLKAEQIAQLGEAEDNIWKKLRTKRCTNSKIKHVLG